MPDSYYMPGIDPLVKEYLQKLYRVRNGRVYKDVIKRGIAPSEFPVKREIQLDEQVLLQQVAIARQPRTGGGDNVGSIYKDNVSCYGDFVLKAAELGCDLLVANLIANT